tara:strand:+ start:28377 stop:29036 length:660 start_codon:yes stop_codon:yes gene_type:complete
MDVSNEAASVSIENTGLPSCGQKLNVGMSSSVQIGFSVKDQGSGWGSGNYMKLGKYRFIITAAHVVSEGEIFIMNGDTVVPLKIVYNNPERDIAIVVPLGDVPATAKHLKINKSPDLEGTPTNYTGYPSDMGKSVYSGMVSKSSEKAALIQSFALPGSSGSVVFDNKGRAIGIVSAVKLLQNPFSPYPELVETVVYVERFTFINKRFLKEVFVSAATGE